VSPVKYELGFYIAEGDILHSDRRGNLIPYISHSHVTIPPILLNQATSYYLYPFGAVQKETECW
jgi:hypothetical protein